MKYDDVLEMPDFHADDGTVAAVAARFINFKTGSAELRPGHHKWLDHQALPEILARPNAWIDLFGWASKLGNRTKNEKLSFARAEAARNYLRSPLASHGRSIDRMVGIDRGFGEDDPAYDASQSDNDPYWRAAQVCVFGTKPIRVRPPRKHQRLATDFKIRVLSGGSVGVVLQADDYLFEIYDVVRHRRAAFLYTGASLSVGIPQLPGFGGLGVAGPWTYFTTDREAELHQFNTRASLYVDPGAAIGPYPIGGTLRLTLKEVHDAAGLIFTRPRIIPVSATTLVTSPSLGSAGDGVLALVSRVSP